MTNGSRWKSKPANIVDPSANAAMKRRMHNVRMREMRLRREEAAREIEAARFARLPWPVLAIGRLFDLFYKVTGL
jgi:hypothetical protein